MTRRHIFFLIGNVALLSANSAVLGALVTLGRENPTASHHVLVPFVTIALICFDRESIFQSGPQRPSRVGGLVALFGLFGLLASSWWSGASNDSLGLKVAAIVLVWLGGFALCYGAAAFRAALFPLVFLSFMIPFPVSLIEGATRFLKSGSADAVAGLFTLTGTPYHRDAFVFSLPTIVIEIADECSGIRSSLGLMLTSLLAGHMFLLTSWKKAVLVVAVIPLAIIKNAVRIVSLSLLAIHVDPTFLTGQLHHEGGVVFFVLALVMLSPFFLLLRKSEQRAAKTPLQAAPQN